MLSGADDDKKCHYDDTSVQVEPNLRIGQKYVDAHVHAMG